mmetsp:Transcript_31103/g.52235  ORF Transcript_31103/g.52235 Transcript_31103/m.52235 type:complete len:218 (-) Transcript_31103:1065-1718(-)
MAARASVHGKESTEIKSSILSSPCMQYGWSLGRTLFTSAYLWMSLLKVLFTFPIFLVYRSLSFFPAFPAVSTICWYWPQLREWPSIISCIFSMAVSAAARCMLSSCCSEGAPAALNPSKSSRAVKRSRIVGRSTTKALAFSCMVLRRASSSSKINLRGLFILWIKPSRASASLILSRNFRNSTPWSSFFEVRRFSKIPWPTARRSAYALPKVMSRLG